MCWKLHFGYCLSHNTKVPTRQSYVAPIYMVEKVHVVSVQGSGCLKMDRVNIRISTTTTCCDFRGSTT